MALEQLGDIVSGARARIRISSAEGSEIAGEIGTDDGGLAAKQLGEIVPALVELAEQCIDPTTGCRGLVLVVGPELAEQLAKPLAFALTEPALNVTSRHSASHRHTRVETSTWPLILGVTRAGSLAPGAEASAAPNAPQLRPGSRRY
jgi:hypothetical protein